MSPRLTLSIAVAFLALHALVPIVWPVHAAMISLAFTVAAPLLAALAALGRGRREGLAPTRGWSVAALALTLWALGAGVSAYEALLLNDPDLAPREGMFLYVLYGVPFTWAIASVWRQRESRAVRWIDAVLASTLGVLFFIQTWAMVPAVQSVSNGQLDAMVWMFDAQNLFLCSGAWVRWLAADTPDERRFFGAVSAYMTVYLLAAGLNNHLSVADPRPDVGPALDLLTTAPFMLFIVLASRRVPAGSRGWRPPPRRLVRFVRSASPMAMALALLGLGLVLVRTQYGVGCAGVLVAVLGFGLRTTLSELRQLETVDGLRDDRRSLQVLAWNDALTGVPNRRAFNESLEREWRRAARGGHRLSLLMIDIDEFKRLNDRHGHVAGDACLREVAQALRAQLQRPTDLLARYGGEEFAVLLAETDGAGASILAQAMCNAVRALGVPNFDSAAGTVTISVGVAAVVPDASMVPLGLVQAADAALYRAKQTGRNRVVQDALAA